MMETITYIESFLPAAEADALLPSLAKLPWTHGVNRFGKTLRRAEVWIGPYAYAFGNPPRILDPTPWTPETEALRDRIQDCYGGEYNSVLLNRYPNGKAGVPLHADDEPKMDPQHPIASVSLGACREFQIVANDTGKIESILLSHGSLLIMPAGFQQKHKHCVPEAKTAKERINLTFRRMT